MAAHEWLLAVLYPASEAEASMITDAAVGSKKRLPQRIDVSTRDAVAVGDEVVCRKCNVRYQDRGAGQCR